MPEQLLFTDIGINDRTNAYLSDLFRFCRHHFGKNLASMVLFGSHAQKTASELSDVDIIIILADSVSKKNFKQLKGKIEWLENKYGYFLEAKGILRFFRALERTTGMFVSHFICLESEFLEGRFSDIFGVNRILSHLIAPTECVLHSFQKQAITIWGKDLLPLMRKPVISSSQFMKSLVMNLFQSTGTLILSPLTNESTRRTLEALKWSIYTANVWLSYENLSLKEIISKITPKSGFLKNNLLLLLSLRIKYYSYPKIIFFGPILVFMIHQRAIRLSKLKMLDSSIK